MSNHNVLFVKGGIYFNIVEYVLLNTYSILTIRLFHYFVLIFVVLIFKYTSILDISRNWFSYVFDVFVITLGCTRILLATHKRLIFLLPKNAHGRPQKHDPVSSTFPYASYFPTGIKCTYTRYIRYSTFRCPRTTEYKDTYGFLSLVLKKTNRIRFFFFY